MIDIETSLAALPVVSCKAGTVLLHQDSTTNSLYFLREGCVQVMKDSHEIATVRDKGAVFGDMSVLLGIPHSATVLCMEDSSFHHIEHPAEYLQTHPALLLHIAQILGMRLFNLNQYLVDLKTQYEGHDHLGMVDEVLETLLNQQKTRTLKRSDSKRDVPNY